MDNLNILPIPPSSSSPISEYDDDNIPEIDTPKETNAIPSIPEEMPIKYTSNSKPDKAK